jgi:hypothetical protein
VASALRSVWLHPVASGIASKIGQAFRLRRGDRVCWSAALPARRCALRRAIGELYGFELIIGSYSIASLAGMAAC